MFIYIAAFYAVAIPILIFGVDYEQGMVDAGKITAESVRRKESQMLPLMLDSAKKNDEHHTTQLSEIVAEERHDANQSQTSVVSVFNVVEAQSYGAT